MSKLTKKQVMEMIEAITNEQRQYLVDLYQKGNNSQIEFYSRAVGLKYVTLRKNIQRWHFDSAQSTYRVSKIKIEQDYMNDIQKDLSFSERLALVRNCLTLES